jgi:3-hydroxyacyl-[acyl-carrier-protein] dehydratase
MSAAGRAGFRFLRLHAAPGWDAAPRFETVRSAASTEQGEGRTAEHGSAASGRRARRMALAEVEVAADSPLFAGHFPGHPVLPGIAHLALLLEGLDELNLRGGVAGDTAIAEVRHLRLRRPVAPGDRLELRIEASGDEGVLAFELRRLTASGKASAELASQGTVRTGAASTLAPSGPAVPARAAPARSAAAPAEPESAQPAFPAPAAAQLRSALAASAPTAARGAPSPPAGLAPGFPPVSALLPHAPPARLLTAVLATGAGGIVCAGAIPTAHPLAAAGRVPGFVALEMGAQAAAALQSLLRRDPAAAPRIGYLVGVRDAHLVAALPTGRPIRVAAVPAGSAAALALSEIELHLDGKRLASGTLSTFLTDA